MPKIISCIANEHDFAMVLLATFILVIGVVSFVTSIPRLKTIDGRLRWNMIAYGAFVILVTTWATHFVAMVGYEISDTPKQYAFGLTFISALVLLPSAAIAITLALYISSAWGRIVGGGILGLGIGIMHYSGVNALQVPFGIK